MAWAADSPPWALSMLSMMALRSPWLEATMTSSSRSPANVGPPKESCSSLRRMWLRITVPPRAPGGFGGGHHGFGVALVYGHQNHALFFGVLLHGSSLLCIGNVGAQQGARNLGAGRGQRQHEQNALGPHVGAAPVDFFHQRVHGAGAGGADEDVAFGSAEAQQVQQVRRCGCPRPLMPVVQGECRAFS